MQLQESIALPTRSYSTLIAVVATVVAAMLALALVFSVGRPGTSNAPQELTLRSVGAEQIAHNRSEEGLGGSSIAGQQIAHDRSEQGFTN